MCIDGRDVDDRAWITTYPEVSPLTTLTTLMHCLTKLTMKISATSMNKVSELE